MKITLKHLPYFLMGWGAGDICMRLILWITEKI